MNDFENKLDRWLDEVAIKCDKLASNKEFDLDFYVFQSTVTYNPKLMFIGANPGGAMSYSKKNGDKKRTKSDLGEGENTFIKYYNERGWERLKPLYDMFKDNGQLEEYFRNAVITNLSYFNSGTFSNLKSKMKVVGDEPLTFCLNKNIELIEKIVRPQNIILLGATARNNFAKYMDKGQYETILETKEKRVALIRKASMTYFDDKKNDVKIPVYIIEHPSAWNGLNSKENITLKSPEHDL
ncbi:MAG: hypothetical protein ACM3RX_07855 [Methanococcaceae archaeon]